MIQGKCQCCGGAVDMDANHDGDICTECGAVVKFRVHPAEGRLVFLAGALELFAIETESIDTYKKTQKLFGKRSPTELKEIMLLLEGEIAVTDEASRYMQDLQDSLQAVMDLADKTR